MGAAGHDDDQASPRPQVSLSASGSGHAQMPVLGQGSQTNNFVVTENHDILLVIAHEQSEIDVDPDREVFSVEITNHGRDVRELSLRAVGVPASVAVVVPDTISVNPDKTEKAKIVLRCTATVPEAGARWLWVRADVRAGHDPHSTWTSDPKKIIIPARPKLKVSFTPPESKVSIPGVYRATVGLANLGNTRIGGSVRIPSRDQVAHTLGPGWAARMLDAEQVGFATSFELAPNETADFKLDVPFRELLWRSRGWLIPILAEADRDDVASVLHQFQIHQHGLLSDLPFFVANARAALRARLSRFRSWGARPVGSRRGVFLALLAAVLAAGLTTGLLIGSAGGEQRAGGPIQTTDASPSSTAEASAGIYSEMPCVPGTYAILLATLSGKDSDAEARRVFNYEQARTRATGVVETARAPWVAPELLFTVHASTWDGMCPAVVRGHTSEDPTKLFIWIGPAPAESLNHAQSVCAALGKPRAHDCVPRPTT